MFDQNVFTLTEMFFILKQISMFWWALSFFIEKHFPSGEWYIRKSMTSSNS